MIDIGHLIFDLDGVVYLDHEEIPGAGETLDRAAAAGIDVRFATNNASRTKADLAMRIREITGFPARPDQIYTSAMAAAVELEAGQPTLPVAGAGVSEAIKDAGATVVEDWRQAEAVIVGFDVTMTYERLRDAALAIRSGARFLAANTDHTFPTPTGQWPGAGASVSFLETATGASPDVVAGKPHEPMRSILRAGLDQRRTMLVGDRPETDIATGLAEGWTTTLVLTGVVETAAEVPTSFTPDHVIESIAELSELVGF